MNYIYFTGYDAEHAGDFVFDITEGYNCHLLLITHTPARFRIGGTTEEYPAHCAMLYTPRTPIWYSASTTWQIWYWICNREEDNACICVTGMPGSPVRTRICWIRTSPLSSHRRPGRKIPRQDLH